MDGNKNTRIGIFIVLVVFALVVGVGGYISMKYFQEPDVMTDVNPGGKAKSYAKKVDVPASEYPDRIPKDLPFPAGAKLEQNYSKGNIQSTRAVVTNETGPKLFEAFVAYGKAGGWTEKTSLQQGNYRLLLLEKKKDLMQIDFSTNTETKQTTVTVTVSPSI